MILFDLQTFFLDYTYAAVFAVLFLMGLGLPIPEEVALVLGGYLCFEGLANPYLLALTCVGAIVSGDLMPYMAGRIWGEPMLRSRRLRRWINPRRIRRFNRLFMRWGARAIFFARFFPGIRSVAYLVAGTLRMSLWKFLVLDLLGVCITVPISLWIGYYFGADIQSGIAHLKQIERGLAVLIGVPVGCIVLWLWWRHRFTSDPAGRRVGSESDKAAQAPSTQDEGRS